MDNKPLQTLLERLHAEIQGAQKIDEKGIELLKDLDQDIRALIERSGETGASSDTSMLGRLQAAIDHLEITHPTLTMTLSELMTILSNAGI